MTTLWWMVSFETGLFHHRQVHADPTNPIHTEPTSTFAFSLRYPLMQGNQLRTLSSVLRHQKGLKIVHQNNAFEIPQWKSPCPPFSENMVYLKIHEWQCRGVDIHHVQRHFKRFWLIHPMSRICLPLKGITQNMVEHAYMYIYIYCVIIYVYIDTLKTTNQMWGKNWVIIPCQTWIFYDILNMGWICLLVKHGWTWNMTSKMCSPEQPPWQGSMHSHSCHRWETQFIAPTAGEYGY